MSEKLDLKDQAKIVKLRVVADSRFMEGYQEVFDRLLIARSVYPTYSDVQLLHYLFAIEIRERQTQAENEGRLKYQLTMNLPDNQSVIGRPEMTAEELVRALAKFREEHINPIPVMIVDSNGRIIVEEER